MFVHNNRQISFDLTSGDLVELNSDFWSYNPNVLRAQSDSLKIADSKFHINNMSPVIVVSIENIRHGMEYNDIVISIPLDGVMTARVVNSSCLREIICKGIP